MLSQQLNDRIDTLVSEHPESTLAVSVIDPSTETMLHVNGDRLFHAASTMKVPVLVELFRQAGEGRISMTDSIRVVNEFRSIVDGSAYAIEDDSDDRVYSWLGTNRSLYDLAYQMITVSSNLATNLLIELVRADSVQNTTERLGTTRMITLRGVEDLIAYEQGLSNRTTSRDLALVLEAIMQDRAVSPEADAEMRSFLFDQQFNDMIPAGLPAGTQTAHKTGQITEINHDAAIVYPDGGNPYVLVILIEGIANPDVSAELGANLAGVIHEVLRPN